MKNMIFHEILNNKIYKKWSKFLQDYVKISKL